MYSTGIKETALLPESDCLTVKTRTHFQLDMPLHRHSEYELNLMENGAGARRIIGHHLEKTSNRELVLIGSGLNHSWQPHLCRSKKITETILHFHSNLFSEEFLQRQQLKNIKLLLSAAGRGISFS